MDIYIYTSVILFLLAAFEPIIPQKIRLFLFIITGLWLTSIVGLRTCGQDFFLYKVIYENSAQNTWLYFADEYRWGYLYSFLITILDYQLLTFSIATITILILYLLIYRTSNRLLLGVFIVFSIFFFNILMMQSRQGLALAIVLFAYQYRDRISRFIPLIILAITIHTTAAIALIAIFIPDKLYNLKTYILLLCGSFIFYYFAEYILSFAGNIGIEYISHKISSYQDRSIDYNQTFRFFWYRTYFFYLLFIIMWYNMKYLKNIKDFPLYFNIFFFGILFYNMFGVIFELSMRGSLYFSFIYIILSLIIINVLKTNKLKIQNLILLLLLLSFSVFNQYVDVLGILKIDAIDGLIPYTNYLFK